MIHVSFTRAEWEMIAGMIADGHPDTSPPGLVRRIDELLRATPASWPNEPCVLELDPDTAAFVQHLAGTQRGLADAERIIQTHQEGNPAASHRIELRSDGVSSIVAYLTDSTDLHRQLEQHASRLSATATTGHLALVEQATLDVLATVQLTPGEGTE